MSGKSECAICLEGVEHHAGSESVRIACGHVYHRECIEVWVRSAQNCPTCRGVIEVGSEDFPLDVEGVNTPDCVLKELHRQLCLLQQLTNEKRGGWRVHYWRKSVQLRYSIEIAEWEVNMYEQWKDEEGYVKLLLVGNFISSEEMDRYFNCFRNDHIAFFKRCINVQDYRIVEEF